MRPASRNMPAAAAKHRDGSPTPRPPQRPLATDRVRYVGEPIAMVVAETGKQAKDAAEIVFVDIDPLPAVTTAERGGAPGAPLLHDEAPGNVCLDFHYGDSEQVAAAFARAAHVTTLSMRNNRIVVCADGAALGDRRIRCGERSTGPAPRLPGRVRPAQPAERHPRRAGGEAARAHRQCRRLVRHEGRRPIRNISACCTPRARSAVR